MLDYSMNFKFNTILLSIIILIFISSSIDAQNFLVTGNIKDSLNKTPISSVEIYNSDGNILAISDQYGNFKFRSKKGKLDLIILSEDYKVYNKSYVVNEPLEINIKLSRLSIKLSQIEVIEKKKEMFALERLEDVKGTSIYAGKKTEVILMTENQSGLAVNNARQIFKQVVGLNIYQNDDAGLQLNIGGRGLDPNRTSNFNTRQNGYDISADVLGYPESYYTPPSEALEKIEIIRGAASLQYGTQFGGLINFILKSPSQINGNKYIIRNTAGSNGLYSNFSSIDGRHQKLSYYSFFNYKKGNGFRDNSNFDSKNAHIHLKRKINNKISASFELTYLNYLAQQAGGMNDDMFLENPLQSNRSRNWFKVNWLLYNIKLNYIEKDSTKHSLSIFGLDADRYALGYRSNRVFQADPMIERDLIHGEFKNYGFEYKILKKNRINNINTTNLYGIKYYKSNNKSIQGPGSDGSDADFKFYNSVFPAYQNQSSYKYPNLNMALFSENILYLNKKISITPGIRYEQIKTVSDGSYKFILLDGAGNAIADTTYQNYSKNEREFILLGLGLSYKIKKDLELYGNISQNYRSVTFADISIVNPAYIVNPNIEDEKGYTSDFGLRGSVKNRISYDINAFQILYEKRIGFVPKVQDDGNVKSEKGNIGDAKITGLESLIDINLFNIIPSKFKLNYFINGALINSEYFSSEQNGIIGNNVEFVPKTNIKTGLYLTYKNLNINAQYTYLSQQFTDASNAVESSLSGVIGQIPEYKIVDLSLSLKKKMYAIEYGINNLLNESYYTRRATGYPGPGIIPSPPRNHYLTLELNF